MRLRIASAAVLAGLLAVASTAVAQAPAAPKPAPEMAQLEFFEGYWTCEGNVEATPFGPAGKITSTVKAGDDLGGFWQSGTVKGTMTGMPPMEGKFHVTWDPGSKAFVMFWVDSMGAWSRSTAPGWAGDKLVYTGEGVMSGQKTASRDTFTRNADGSLGHSWEMQVDGKWIPGGSETCRKGPRPEKKEKKKG